MKARSEGLFLTISQRSKWYDLKQFATAVVMTYVLLLSFILPSLKDVPLNFAADAAERGAYEQLVDANDANGADYADLSKEEFGAEGLTVLAEDEAKRTETAKHYILSDGTYMMKDFGVSVHYMKDDKWLAIDNTLSFDKNGALINKNNSFNVSFMKNLKSQDVVKIQENGIEIEMMLLQKSGDSKLDIGAAKEKSESKTEAVSAYKEKSAFQAKQDFFAASSFASEAEKAKFNDSLYKVSDSVKYAGALSDFELEYVVEGRSLKENIIVKQPATSYVYEFSLKMKNAYAEMDEYGDIIIFNKDSDAPSYKIPKGYMYDAKGAYSNDVKYDLVESDGGYVLRVIADEKWINDESRAFPVTIDPTIVTHTSNFEVKNVYSNGSVGSDFFAMAYSDRSVGQAAIRYAIIKYNVDFNARNLRAASLEVQTYDYNFKYYYANGNTENLSDQRFAMDCKLMQSGGNLLTAASEAPIMFRDDRSGDNTNYEFDVTSYVAAATNGSNYGMVIVPVFANSYLKSCRLSNPVLSIYYSRAIGKDPKAAYVLHEMPGVGAGQTKLSDGQLLFEHNLLDMGGGALPFVLTNTYDSNWMQMDTNAYSTTFTSGLGWRLNLEQMLFKISRDLYLYYDKTGREIVFRREYASSTHSTWCDTEGLGLLLEESGSYTYLKDMSGNKLTFYEERLVKIEDNFGHALTIARNSENNITSVTDSSGSRYDFSYLSTNTNYNPISKISRNGVTLLTFNYVQAVFYNPTNSFLIRLLQALYGTFQDVVLSSVVNNVTGVETTYETIFFKEFQVSQGGKSMKYDWSQANQVILTQTNMGQSALKTIRMERYDGIVRYKDSTTWASVFYDLGKDGEINSKHEVIWNSSATAIDPISATAHGVDLSTNSIVQSAGNIIYRDTFDNVATGGYFCPDEDYYVKDSGTKQQSMKMSADYSLVYLWDWPATPQRGEYVVSFWMYQTGELNLANFYIDVLYRRTSGSEFGKTFKFDIKSSVLNRWKLVTLTVPLENSSSITHLYTYMESRGADVYIDDYRVTLGAAKMDLSDSTEYDDRGRVTRTQAYNSVSGAVDIYEYTYDDTGKLVATEVKELLNGVERTVQSSIFIYFFSDDKITEMTELVLRGQEIKGSIYRYDTSGNLTEYVGQDGISTLYSYDTVNKKISETRDGVTTVYSYNGDYSRLNSIAVGGNMVSYTYNQKGEITSVRESSGNKSKTATNFAYDQYGNITGISVGSQSLINYAYSIYTGQISGMTYANSDSFSYEYDRFLRPLKEKYNGTTKVQYNYNSSDDLTGISDYYAGIETAYNVHHNSFGATNAVVMKSGNGVNEIISNHYNASGIQTVKQRQIQVGSGSIETSNYAYSVNSSCQISSFTGPFGQVSYIYDSFGQRTASSMGLGTSGNSMNTQHVIARTGQITGLKVSLNSTLRKSYTYQYYADGKVKSVDNGYYRYVYDNLGRLVREDNSNFGKTYIYSYMNYQDLTASEGCCRYLTYKETFPYSTDALGTPEKIEYMLYYNDGWWDQLTAVHTYVYENGGYVWGGSVYYGYDEMGNQTARNASGSTTTYTWTRGRMLASQGSTSYTYDMNGLRTKKVSGNVTTQYFWDNGQLYAELRGNTMIYYYYDDTGIIGMNYGGQYYYFVKNLFGDVIEIWDANGTYVGGYGYDAFGNTKVADRTAAKIATANPFRYRGYYQDGIGSTDSVYFDSGYYYLKSRYYDPSILSFISADDPTMALLGAGQIGGTNLYAYCNYDPINYTDPAGYGAGLIFLGILLTIAISGGIGAASNAITAAAVGGDVGAAALGGFVNGVINGFGVTLGWAAGPAGILVAGGFGFVGGFVGSIIEQGLTNKNRVGEFSFSTNKALIYGGISTFFNMVSFAGTRGFLALGKAIPASVAAALTPSVMTTVASTVVGGGIFGVYETIARVIGETYLGGAQGHYA